MDLNFEIENQILRRIDSSENIVNKSKNYLNCNFNFLTPDWDDLIKIAVFESETGEKIHRYLGKYPTSKINVPGQVLNGDYFKLSVYGGDLISTNTEIVILVRSGYSKQVCGEKDIFIDIFEQIALKMDKQEFQDLTAIAESVLTKADRNHTHDVSDILNFNEQFDSRMELWSQSFADAINEL